MHGLFFLPTLGPGGAERVVLNLLKQFSINGVTANLVVITNTNNNLEYLLPSSVVVRHLNGSRVIYKLFSILNIIRKSNADFIFSTHAHVNFLILALSFFLGKKYIYITRESSIISKNITSKPIQRRLWKLLYSTLYRVSDVVICQSKGMASDAIENFCIPQRLISIIGNPVDDKTIESLSKVSVIIKRDPNDIFLVSAGRFTPDKGFDLLLHAIATLNNKRIHLLLIGEGRDFESTVEIAKKLGILDKVSFLGYKQNPYPYYVMADFYVMSSRFEGFPNSVLEALALGTPVIATPCPGGIHDILIDRVNGFFAKAVSSDSLAEAIKEALNLPIFLRSEVKNSVIPKYSIENIGNRYFDIINNVVKFKGERFKGDRFK